MIYPKNPKNDLELAITAKMVAATMISDLYDSCGDSIYTYVNNPVSVGAYALEDFVLSLTDKEIYDVTTMVRSYLVDAFSSVTSSSPEQPTLF